MDELLAFVIALCVLFGGCIIGSGVTNDRWIKDTIERGLGEYNPTTGEWQWKENEEKGDE